LKAGGAPTSIVTGVNEEPQQNCGISPEQLGDFRQIFRNGCPPPWCRGGKFKHMAKKWLGMAGEFVNQMDEEEVKGEEGND